MTMLSRRYDVMGIDRHPWWGDQALTVLTEDITAPAFLKETLPSFAPDILIHCAAMVNVDACEIDAQQAYATNAMLTRRLLQAMPANCRVVYLSTDSVFQGDTPFVTEEELPSPRTVYARSKLQGEWEVAQRTDHHLIIRTNFYGWSSGRKKTFGEWLYHALETGTPITLFDDFFFTPLYVMECVERIVYLIEGGYHGTFHLGGQDRISKYQFGMLMAKVGNLSTQHIRRGQLDEAGLRAPRPKDMSLSSDRFHRLTGLPVPDVLSGIQRFLDDRERSLSARIAAAEKFQTMYAFPKGGRSAAGAKISNG